ncbi:hypothetical protein [Ruegeria sp. Ofav3-42]|uniref:hypothetical protein n=1 Tax=Ruegeria sp. Ofav3-42 TaxID=2917759 RepID=UPI001EF48143|nr:hypothetical protein [Ruegeria sp. Ofav3-42]MCG7520310.1 hypothetical protein [Ruegeria sp. Ofav3-42]
MAETRIWLAALTAMFASANHSAACVASKGERTFLHELTEETKHSEFVALIEIVKVTDDLVCFPKEHRCFHVGIEVEVIEPISGSTRGQTVTAAKSKGSCSTDNNLIAGQQYYLSGEIIENVLWSGPKGADSRNRKWKPTGSGLW